MDMLSTATVLFLIMDPLGNLPIVLSMLKNLDSVRRRKVLIRELLIALFILIIFLFLGESIMTFLRLEHGTLSISGGIILFIIAIKMIFPASSNNSVVKDEEPFIVPIAIPLIAGPSVIAALLLLSSQYPESLLSLLCALLIAWIATFLILIFHGFFHHILGEKGLKAFEKLMGLVLVMISIQMLINGIKNYAILGSS
ncbi:multiple antibiotic resistance protein marC [Candidatus Photodesmus katoptron]|uniref:UPF0056 membrane protein n=1 Tax=Candidatus Photodesmus katoptron Akat1 TaxID=1236703 RepID=S3DJJ0_9GAMM|nr:YhgN family NAAT transporter [Candidatus Photodesmus katoptron]EPE37289.1 MarC integral membrane protein [Candidatus Photodesmus katoptron Akat1]KEY90040.1 multiple antibiotic resistance protein marC [Candidatus Photodesmus katoptron]